MEFKHISVLLKETVDALNVSDGGIYVDGTLGGGGHSYEILSRSESCSVIGIDRDSEAIEAAKKRLSPFGARMSAVKGSYCDVSPILEELGIDKISGAVLDLGVSSYQLDNAERGFSYMHDAPLDMRMDRSTGKSAFNVINEYSADDLKRVFYDYGEEKWSARIADFIVREREKKPIATTGELVDIIRAAIPERARMTGGHPAKRIFQAVRIEVNGELEPLAQAIRDFFAALEPGGRLAVITFHSLEDRIVKNTYRELAQGCICPKSFPVCVCNNKPKAKIITSKPILPTKEETENNPRAKSAKLRILEALSRE